ncbi:MAG: PEP-CTERM sorting domain-containing protein [Pirellulaceae bacterium]|nr:PEP-CTERM sorting domain-containing protein [Pirellulaceae bacterium]
MSQHGKSLVCNVIAVVVSFSLMCGIARAELVAYDGFGTSGSLNGTSTGTGFSSSWTAVDAFTLSGFNPTLPGNAPAASGGCAGLASVATISASRDLSSELSSTSGDTWYVSFNLDSFGMPQGWFRAELHSDEGPWVAFGDSYTDRLRQHKIIISDGSNIADDLPGLVGSNTLYYVMKLVTQANGTVDAYMNYYDVAAESLPATEPAAWAGHVSLSGLNCGFDSVTFKGRSYADNDAEYFDELRIGTTWADMVVPEPGTLVLLVCGLIGLLAYARRKNSVKRHWNWSWKRTVNGTAVAAGAWLVLATGAARADYVSTVLDDNPVAYWRLNETGGDETTMHDSATDDGDQSGTWHIREAGDAGLGYDGPRPSAYPGFEADNKAPRLLWGRTQPTYVDIGNPSELRITGALTLEAWIYAEADDHAYGVVSKWLGNNYGNPTDDRSYTLMVNDGNKPGFWVCVDGSLDTDVRLYSDTAIPLGAWAHLVGVFVPSQSMRLYINGQLDKEITEDVPGTIYDSDNADVWIGMMQQKERGFNFKGRIDEAAIYDLALSGERIAAHYAAATIPEPGTIALLASGLIGLLAYAWRRRK